ncbi:hypothetical protein [Raoultibacter phocaeensis]|uniref:hypothetical protein n=1 Tax=Raoultibacter phocaeensis TaxID=2479841 RepID=UPI0011199DB9|nr:hypothetical protein [Raoultibacter phocaeensis]
MAVLYEDSFVLVREASELMDEALSQTADPNARGQIRAAFYKLYQAANSATMISPLDVRAVAEGSEAYQLIVEYPYKLYYREGRYPVADLKAVFDRWVLEVSRYVDDLSASAKLSVVKPSREKR